MEMDAEKDGTMSVTDSSSWLAKDAPRKSRRTAEEQARHEKLVASYCGMFKPGRTKKMDTVLSEKATVKTIDGETLTIAPGTEKNASYDEILAFWEDMWAQTEGLRPNHSVVGEFLIEKRIEVERENQGFPRRFSEADISGEVILIR